MKLLTFVIPAYNSEKFLDKCITSLLAAEVLEKLEIIVINDGSTDGTVQIAENYCTNYPDVVRLISQENKGHGGALNTGCVAAQGKYLKVIDADDWVETQNLSIFIRHLENCDSEVVLTHYHTIDISNGEIKNWRNYPDEFEKRYSFADVMSSWKSFDRSLTFHGITYRTDFYQKYAKPLPEHVFYEDHEYATFPCCMAESITCFDLFIYDYRIGDVNQSVSNQNQLKRIAHTDLVIRRMIDRYCQLPESDGKRYAAMKTQGLILSYLTTVLLVNPNRAEGQKQAKTIMEHCQRNALEIYNLALRKYQVFHMMNRLHIGKDTWDAILNSRIYKRVYQKHDFK